MENKSKKNKQMLTLLAVTGIFMNSAILPIVTTAEGIEKANEINYGTDTFEVQTDNKESKLSVAEGVVSNKDFNTSTEQNEEALTVSKVTEKKVSDTSAFDFNVKLTETGKLEETIIEAIKWYEENWYDLEAGHSVPPWSMQQNINITTTVPLNEKDWETVRRIPELSYNLSENVVQDLKNVDIIRLNSSGFNMEIPDDALNFDGGGSGKQESDPKIINTWLRSFESNATSIGANFGSYTWKLKNLVLHNATIIGDGFLNFSRAEHSEFVTINLPEVSSIGDNAFNNSRVELVAPQLKNIGDNAFYGTTASMVELPVLENAGNRFFAANNTGSHSMIFIAGDGLETFTILEGVASNHSLNLELPNLTTLGENSFNLSNLYEVSLPKLESLDKGFVHSGVKVVSLGNVEEIRNSFRSYVEFGMNISGMTVNAPMLKTVDNSFSGRGDFNELTLNAPLIEEIGDNSFSRLGSGININNFNFPNLLRVGNNSFENNHNSFSDRPQCMAPTSFIAPKLSSVGNEFMRGVTSLEILNVPKLKTIGELSFSSWYSPNSMGSAPVDYPAPSLKQIEIGLSNLDSLSEFFAESKKSLTDLRMNAVEEISDDNVTLQDLEVLEHLTMNNVKIVGNNSLKDLRKLTTVEMLEAHTFGNSSFEQALNLESVNLPNATIFGSNAFDMRDKQSKLDEVVFPNLTKMGNNAFRGASNLREVELPKLKEIGSHAFYMTKNLKVLFLPNLSALDTDHAFEGEGFQALIFSEGKLDNETLASIFNTKSEILGVLVGANKEYQLIEGDDLLIDDSSFINESTAKVERSYRWSKDDLSLDNTLNKYQKENIMKEDSGIYTSSILLNDNEYSVGTHKVSVSDAPEVTKFETDDYHIGDYNITGRFSAPIVTAQLRIDGNISNRGGTFNKSDGTFYYYAGAGRIQVDQDVVLEGLNEQGEIVKSIKIDPKIKEGSLNNVEYTLGNNTIVGEYTGKVRKARLVVNGTIVSVGGTFDEGRFSYYINPTQIKETDTVQIQGYDAEDNPIGNLALVALKRQEGNLIEANYKVGESTITGKYEGNVKKARLIVDDKPVSWGGDFKEGEFSYYVSPGTIEKDSKVELAIYGVGDYLLSEENFVVDVKSDTEE
ncbi:leucine-rich repeat protein [Enterococcus faecalis]|nr:leucine-rich repeat domain-containing protein [Enterococcus faecalis]EJW9249086.1 leucine-rich repeat protein [Enterococcus faecalis]